ncbi:MAG: hypothetical protein K2O31_02975 [Clostridia bacterium]|nr:hypothetical protein [Clostridia bacterium]MDE7208824.1 hypothetical protein [Clostridia bacterium]
MWDQILQLAIGDGLWALLFCVLLIYELKDSRARETKYQNTISSLAKDLEYMKDMDEEIEDMNNAVREYMESVVKDSIESKSICNQSPVTSNAEEII